VDEAEIARGTGALDGRFELAAIARIATAEDDGMQLGPVEPRDRIDQHELPLPAREPARQEHQRRALGQAPGFHQRDQPLRLYLAGIEAVDVDAARNDAQALGRDAVIRRDMLTDEMRDR